MYSPTIFNPETVSEGQQLPLLEKFWRLVQWCPKKKAFGRKGWKGALAKLRENQGCVTAPKDMGQGYTQPTGHDLVADSPPSGG
jgi:hypothetical protein